ncbi:MAG TPA: GntP family permease [Candidatus Flavonifractor intestinipullorum]|uniref:GntP family permease n=1 Tax=Candidatus Flavonifractor intestinipullorum TaxID=2838587 RepID=A0A9D2M9U6_9FIRM|nr:GntP family permease [Candidatus Flavonifractor intestinipullorum]
MNWGILILLIAIILFGVLAFKGISALILAPLVTCFVLIFAPIFAGEDIAILNGLKEQFMPAAADYVSSYFLMFFMGALFGAVYQFTGAAKSIAKWLAGMCHGKFVAPIIMCITGLLTYGGISGFVVFFVIYPIALQMFRSANLTRRLIPAAISAGCWTWSMYGPGSPSIQNVIPIESLGTTPTAALVPSVIATVASFVMIFVWLEYRARSFTKRGYFFDDPRLKMQLSPEELQEDDPNEVLPNPIVALVPIVVILVLFNIVGLPVETAVFIGVALATILFFTRIEGGINGWLKVFNKGAADSGVSILNTAIVVGFGGVVQNTKGFTDLVNSLQNLDMNPLIFVMITVAVCAGACGSASGGMGVAFNALKDVYAALGANFEYVHRIGAIAAGTLDTLPHQGAQITLLGICKCTHKEAYFDIAITQIAVPFITCFIFIALASTGMM